MLSLTRVLERSLLELEAELAEATNAGLITSAFGARHRRRFEHPWFRSAIYWACTGEERDHWHARYAQQIAAGERQARGQRRSAASSNSGPGADVSRQHEGSQVLSAQKSQAIVAAGEAGGSIAVQHLYAAQSPALATLGLECRVEQLLHSAEAHAALGSTPDEMRSIYRHAFDLAIERSSAELAARAALGYGGCGAFRGSMADPRPTRREEIRLLTRAHAAQPEHSIYRVLVQARLGVALASVQRLEEADALTRGALDQAEQLGEPRTLCSALLQRARALSGPGCGVDRITIAQQALSIAECAGLCDLAQDAKHERALGRLSVGTLTAHELSELARAPDVTTTERAIAAAPGGAMGAGASSTDRSTSAIDPGESLRRMGWALTRALMRGEVAQAEGLLNRARRLARSVHPVGGSQLLDGYAWELDRLRGLRGTMVNVSKSAFGEYQLAPWMAFPWLFTMIDQGGMFTARAAYALVMGLVSTLARDQYWIGSIAVAVYAADRFDDAARARWLYDMLLPYAHHNVTRADVGMFLAPVAHYLGGAAAVFGDYEASHSHYDQAQAQAEQLGATVQVLLARKHRALMRLRKGERASAIAELERVRRELSELRLHGLSRDLDSYMRRMAA